MYAIKIKPTLKKILQKLKKKDKRRYFATKKKVGEVAFIGPHHYKNLKYNMKRFRRVHVDSSFVLIFKVEGKVIHFETLKHHDDVYK